MRAAPRPPVKRHRWRRLGVHLRAIRMRVGTAPGGRTLFKVVVAAAGALVVVLGLALVPLPGPGWLIVFGGLAIWAIEFVWARRLLHWVRDKVRVWSRWVGSLPWPVRAALAIAVLAGLVSIAWLWIKYRYGFESMRQFWQYVSTH